MWVYDDFGGLFYYDELDSPTGTVYSQTGNVVLQLSGGATHDWPGAYDHPLDVTVELFSTTTQELQPPAGPYSYTQQGAVTVLLIGGGAQTHIPSFVGILGQTGNVVVTISGDSFQMHLGGGNPGDVVHTSDLSVTLAPAAVQHWSPPELAHIQTQVFGSVRPFGADPVPPLVFTFNVGEQPISRITLSLFVDDDAFQDVVGPSGGGVYVEMSLSGPPRFPLVSVDATNPVAEFTQAQAPEFLRLLDAVQAGAVGIELRAYEALPTRVIGRSLGPGHLTVEALP